MPIKKSPDYEYMCRSYTIISGIRVECTLARGHEGHHHHLYSEYRQREVMHKVLEWWKAKR